MTADLDEALAAVPPAPEAARTVAADRPCRPHRWEARAVGITAGWEAVWACVRCGKVKDPERSRRGRSSRRLGSDQERRLERTYGWRKVGELGDAIDLLGRDWAVQSKASREAPPKWAAALEDAPVSRRPPRLVRDAADAMEAIRGTRAPLVVQSWVRRAGPRSGTLDAIWVRAADWEPWHGGNPGDGWLVMRGDVWLSLHGREEP